MESSQKDEIRDVVNEALDTAERHWTGGGYKLKRAAMDHIATSSVENLFEDEASNIPGHPTVQEERTVIDDFIALVVDIRGSSDRLVRNTSLKKSKVSDIQRVYYETSALLPACAKAIQFRTGSVTEYLGDGVLALFQVDKDDTKTAVYQAYGAAKDILYEMLPIVNKILEERYNLDELKIGIGLGYSNAIVSLIGLPNEKHPKAFGACVFHATKLSDKYNEIHIDEPLYHLWPTGKKGSVKFVSTNRSNVKAYRIDRNKNES